MVTKIEIALALGFNKLAIELMNEAGLENLPKDLQMKLAKVMFLEIVK